MSSTSVLLKSSEICTLGHLRRRTGRTLPHTRIRPADFCVGSENCSTEHDRSPLHAWLQRQPAPSQRRPLRPRLTVLDMPSLPRACNWQPSALAKSSQAPSSCDHPCAGSAPPSRGATPARPAAARPQRRSVISAPPCRPRGRPRGARCWHRARARARPPAGAGTPRRPGSSPSAARC